MAPLNEPLVRKPKPCKLSHVPETKEQRRERLDKRRARQFSVRSTTETTPFLVASRAARDAILKAGRHQSIIGYRPHQGQREMARRQRQAVQP